MPIPNPITLTGGQTGFGTAINVTGYDNFLLGNPGNIVVGGNGNLIVKGEDIGSIGAGFDNASTVYLNTNVGGPATDTVLLDGMKNIVISKTALNNSNVSVTVQGQGNLFQAYGGQNFVQLTNNKGTTGVSLTGAGNTVILNGDAANTVTFVADPTGFLVGSETVVVGSTADDDLFGYNAAITLTDSNNRVFGGDENFTITGGVNNNGIFLGDGNNSVSLSGFKNYIQVGAGKNTITAGSGSDTVVILPVDAAGEKPGDSTGDDAVPASPTDVVNLAGSKNIVQAMGAPATTNVTVNGAGTTGAALILLGDGQNNVFLGGNGNFIRTGNGANTIATTGNGNTIIVSDPTGVSTTDAITVGTGTGNVIYLNMAGGQVTGSDGGGGTTNEVVQDSTATNNLNVDLLNGTGIVLAGNGSDQVRAHGDNSFIMLGNGTDTVNANGANTTVILGNGKNDTVNANGNGAVVSVGNGDNATITANGAGAHVFFGNGNGDVVTANGNNDLIVGGNGNNKITANGNGDTIFDGSGSDTIIALGSGDSIIVSANSSSVDTVTIGSNDILRMSGGLDHILGSGNDAMFLNNLVAGSEVQVNGSNNFIALGGNTSAGSSTEVVLDPAQTGNVILVQATDATGQYGGIVEIQGFTAAAAVDLQGLVGKNGAALNSYGNVLANLVTNPTNYQLQLKGGGIIQFDTTVPFQPSEFGYTPNVGPV
jgi:hypothetical protein